MQWKIHFDLTHGYIAAEQWGPFTMNEQFAFLRAILTSDYWSPGKPLMINYAGLKIVKMESNDLEKISDDLGKLIGQIRASRIALVAGNELQFGLGRAFQMISESRVKGDIEVFRDETAALKWLVEKI